MLAYRFRLKDGSKCHKHIVFAENADKALLEFSNYLLSRLFCKPQNKVADFVSFTYDVELIPTDELTDAYNIEKESMQKRFNDARSEIIELTVKLCDNKVSSTDADKLLAFSRGVYDKYKANMILLYPKFKPTTYLKARFKTFSSLRSRLHANHTNQIFNKNKK